MPDVFRRYELKHIFGRRVELPELVPEVVRVRGDVVLGECHQDVGEVGLGVGAAHFGESAGPVARVGLKDLGRRFWGSKNSEVTRGGCEVASAASGI